MILADKIAEERKKNGWSQEELAERLGVSRQSVSKWESAGSVPDLQKVIQLANLFEVSTDYLLKDELEKENRETGYTPDSSNPEVHRVTMEEANDFLAAKQKAAPVIANGVALCIFSPALLVLLSGLSESGLFSITEGVANGLGCTFCLINAAAAVFLFITCGIKLSHWEYLEREPFETEYGVTGMVKEKRREQEERFSVGIALGVALCILAVIPLTVAGAMEAPDTVCTVCIAVLLLLVALGANIMIRVAMVKGSFDTLLQEGDYSQKKKQTKEKMSALSGAYWCIATAVYLGWSFYTMQWNLTWIVWPVAGVLFAAVSGIAGLVFKQDAP